MPKSFAIALFGLVLNGSVFATGPELLTGCWKGIVDGAEVEERWSGSAGDMMLGTSKTVSKAKATDFEFLKIEIASKKTTYTAFINGKEMPPFTLDGGASNSKKLVFENPANPFPKQVIYELDKDTLKIALVGDSGPNVEYDLTKTACD